MASGREHVKTDEMAAQVDALASFGVNQEEICAFLGICVPILHKYYRDELDNAKLRKSLKVGKFLYTAASGKALEEGATHSDCIRAAMFWAKTQMGWKEVQGIDHTSTDGSMSPKGKSLSDFYDPDVSA